MSEPVRRGGREDDLPAMLIGLLEMASGVSAAGYILVRGWTTTVVRTASSLTVENKMGGLFLLAALLFMTTAYAGLRLWRGDKRGYYLSVALLMVQVIHVYVPGVQIAISCPISVGPAWILDGLDGGPGFLSGYGLTLVLTRARTIAEPSVSINVAPLLAALYLLFAVRRVAPAKGAATAQPSVEADGPSRGLTP